jgi:transposase
LLKLEFPSAKISRAGLRAARQAEQQATVPGSVSETEREELKRLRKEVIELQTDKEILKRAAAYFARETIR